MIDFTTGENFLIWNFPLLFVYCIMDLIIAISYVTVFTLNISEDMGDYLDRNTDGAIIGVPHGQHTFKYSLLYLLVCFLLSLAFEEWLAPVSYLILIPSLRWIFHDMVLNTLNKLPLFYLGTTAKTDRWLRKVTGGRVIWLLLIKLAVFAASVYLVYLLNYLTNETTAKLPFELSELVSKSLVLVPGFRSW